MDTKPTVKIIIAMAEVIERAAKELRREAAELERTGDFFIVGEVISTVINIFANMRLDLLVNHPLQEHEREHKRIKRERE